MALRISVGSGATLASNIINGEHLQVISPVSLYPLPAGSNFIGLASIQGTVNVSGLVSLPSGTEVRSLATINNFPATYPVTDNNGSLTVDWISGATVAISNMPSVTIGSAIPSGTNFIGLVSLASINGNVNVTNSSIPVTQSGNWNNGITGLVSLASGTEVKSLATINNWPATQAVTQSGTWTLQPGNTANTTPWLVTQSNGLISLASGTVVLTREQNLVSLASGTFVSLNAGTNHIGSVSIFGSVTANTGMTTLFPGPNQIGSVTVSNFPATQAVSFNQLVSLASGTEIRSLATLLNQLPLVASSAFIGLVSAASINGTVGGTLANSSDAVATTSTGNIGTAGYNYVVNRVGSFWDRQRSIASSATIAPNWNGVTAAGVLGRDSNNNLQLLTVDLNQNLNVSPVTIANTPAVTQSGTWNVGVNGLISLASGTFVSLNAGTNHIGSVSIFGSVTANTGMTTLFPGPNQIGSVTVSNFPATQAVSFNQLVSLASGTFVSLNAGTNHIGSVSIFGSVTANTGMTTLFPGPNQIGSVTISNIPAVTQSGTWNVGVNGLISLASGTFVSLNAGTNHIGSVSIFGSVTANTGMTTLFPGPNQIGSVTVSNIVPVSQSGSWTLAANSGVDIGDVTLTAGTNFIGLASVQGNVNTTQAGTWTVQPGNTANTTPWLVTQSNGLISLASGTFVSLNAGTTNIGDVDVLTLPATPAGTNFIGLATVVQGNQPALVASSAYIGLASVNIGGTLPALSAGANFIGLISVASINGTVTNAAGTNFIGLVSAASINGTVGLAAGTNVIGTATTYSVPISSYTSFATIYSASGNATLFVAPAAQRWVVKDLLISSQGQQVVSIKSGTEEMFPPIALATLGGFVMNNGDSGLRAKAVNTGFVLNLGATATLSVLANVRFE